MSIYTLLLFWVFTLFFFLQIRKNQEMFIFLKNLFPKRTSELSLMKKWGNIRFFSKPGYFVSKLITEEKYKKKLQHAGEPLSFEEFRTIKQMIFTISEIYFWIFFIFGSWSKPEGHGIWDFALVFIIIIIAFFIPDLWLQIQKEKRQKQLEQDVQYFVDMLSITLETGMNLERAFQYVSEHMKGSLAQEIQKKLIGLRFGLTLERILEDLYNFIPVEDFQRFIGSIKQAKKLGVSLSKTLEIQSQLIQNIRLQKAEELSRTASVKISLPLVLFIFPALLIIYIGPAFIKLMQQ